MAGFPLNQTPTCVFVLYSIHNVMKAEMLLKEKGVTFDTVPVPKEISSDCGMAILVGKRDEERVANFLREAGLDIKGVYLKTTSGYEEVTHG